MTDDADTPDWADRAKDRSAAMAKGLRGYLDDLDPTLPWSVQDSKRAGARVGNAISHQLNVFVANLLLLITRFMPMSQRFWTGLINAGYRGLKKTSGGDAVCHVIEDGRLKWEPIAKKHETEGPTDHPRWVTQSGDWWEASEEGSYLYLAGKTPVAFASAKSNELNDHIQAETATVLDIEGTKRIFTDAQITHQQITVEPDPGQSPGDAIADGGASLNAETVTNVTVDHPGHELAEVVDLGVRDASSKGRVVNMDNYYETYPSTPGPEKMEQQKIMGQLMEKDPAGDKAFLIKIMLIVLGIIAVITMGPPAIKALLGGGSGGSTGMIPLTLGVF